jgi:hypothetical protein
MVRFDDWILESGFVFRRLPWLFLCGPFCGVDILNFLKLDIIVLLDVGVEAVLDLVLRTAGQVLADFRPLAANLAEELQDLPVLIL